MDEVCGFRCGIVTSVKIPLPHFFAGTLELEPELERELEQERELERELELFQRRARHYCPRIITTLASIIQIPPDSGSSVPFLDRGFLEFLPESLKVPSCLPLPSMMVMGASCSQTYSLMTKGKE